MATHFRGPLQVARNTAGGLFDDAPIEVTRTRAGSCYFVDFLDINDFVLGTNWTGTETGTTATAVVGTSGVCGELNLAAETDNEGYTPLQLGTTTAVSALVPADGTTLIYEARVAHSNWSEGDWFIGFGEVDTTFMSAAGALLANGADNHAGFHHVVADDATFDLSMCGNALASIQPSVTGTGTAAAALTDGQFYRFGIRVENASWVRFYIDDIPVSAWTELTADMDVAMTPTFCFIAEGVALTMDIDYVLAAQTRV